ncbi:cyanocobalamin reductase / alkylcobalamin dealkylase isoform X4 [Octopus sinensis]|uniref:Cyanocobalamin reductase (cyanide-eliminating) n=1 Tax=Octopus sinensis TaxID=2607531 RepID=A0A7E6ELF6_9MOLL|nr:cyanocobalamin reductase / alkylcobalamin dealkylase isoform X4 [Octopus sinensis]
MAKEAEEIVRRVNEILGPFGFEAHPFKDYPDTDLIYDFDQKAPRLYSILVQTAAHVAGAAYYYQKKDVINNPWGDKTIFGISIHPQYGGWFAIRAAIIFKNLKFADLKKKDPVDAIPDQETRIKLLNMLNEDWEYWKARDIIKVSERYTEEAINYFKTLPKDRYKLIEDMQANRKNNA